MKRRFVKEYVSDKLICKLCIYLNARSNVVAKLGRTLDNDKRTRFVLRKLAHGLGQHSDSSRNGSKRTRLTVYSLYRLRSSSDLFKRVTKLGLEYNNQSDYSDLVEITENVIRRVHIEELANAEQNYNDEHTDRKLSRTSVSDKDVAPIKYHRQKQNVDNVRHSYIHKWDKYVVLQKSHKLIKKPRNKLHNQPSLSGLYV
jgi:hypothetical protein